MARKTPKPSLYGTADLTVPPTANYFNVTPLTPEQRAALKKGDIRRQVMPFARVKPMQKAGRGRNGQKGCL